MSRAPTPRRSKRGKPKVSSPMSWYGAKPQAPARTAVPAHMFSLKHCVPRSEGLEVKKEPAGSGFELVDEKVLHQLARPNLYGPLAMGFAGMSPLPYTLHAKMKYAEHVLITGTSGALGLYVFNASSLYDPNYTSTGHQPRGFDQIMPLYDHFIVLRSKISVLMCAPTTGSFPMAGVALSSTVTNQGDWDDYAEGPRSTVSMLNALTTSGSTPPREFSLSYDAKSFLGIPDPVTADKLQGTISANPTDNAFYHLFVQDAAETATVGCRALIEIEYDAVFIEPLNPAQS